MLVRLSVLHYGLQMSRCLPSQHTVCLPALPAPVHLEKEYAEINTPAGSTFFVRWNDDHFDRDRGPQQVDHLLMTQRHSRHLAYLH